MEMRRIAVGSTRGPKLDAVQDAVKQFAPLFGAELRFEVQGFQVESGVGPTPLSAAESMKGARQRAEALMRMAAATGDAYQYYVGVEGGLEVLTSTVSLAESSPHLASSACGERRAFLESWAYVLDGTRGHFGRSGAIELPEALAHEVIDRGVELSVAIDKFAGIAGIRDRQGAWGILSGDLISRREAFRVAVVAGFAPFYNASLFRVARAAGSRAGSERDRGSDGLR
jgi:non-canonical (house-cleaning) NTP pyrophosphatase